MKILLAFIAIISSTQTLALELKATSEFSQRYEMNAAVNGIVSDINVQAGQMVKPGQILLKLDATPYRLAVQRAKARLQSLQPDRLQAQTELDKALELFDRDSLAQVELQQFENTLARAIGELDAADAELRLAEFNLKNSFLRAPISALVLSINTHPGRFVNTNFSDMSLLTLVNNSNMIASAFLDVEQWRAPLLGKSAIVSFRGEKYSGKIVELAQESSRLPGQKTVYKVKVLFIARGEIPANMPLTIEIKE